MRSAFVCNITAFDRARVLALALCVALSPLGPGLGAQAQSAETPAPDTDEMRQVPGGESFDTNAERQGCPGCGRVGHGRGAGHGCWGTERGPRGRGSGQGQGHGRGGRQRGGMGDCQRPEAKVIHFLIDQHDRLERTVEEIPGGVRTRTVSQDAEIVEAVRTHVRQMVDLIHGGGRIRNWDPLFREIFDHREAIEMQVEEIEGGIEVTETSADARVTQLIRAHAVKVEDFVARGLEAYREETPLPAEYSEVSP